MEAIFFLLLVVVVVVSAVVGSLLSSLRFCRRLGRFPILVFFRCYSEFTICCCCCCCFCWDEFVFIL